MQYKVKKQFRLEGPDVDLEALFHSLGAEVNHAVEKVLAKYGGNFKVIPGKTEVEKVDAEKVGKAHAFGIEGQDATK